MLIRPWFPARRSIFAAASLVAIGCSSEASTEPTASAAATARATSSTVAGKMGNGELRAPGSSSASPAPSGSSAPSGGPVRRTVDAFNEVRVSTSLEADVDIGPSAPLEITGDDETVAAVKTEVSGGALTISLPPGDHPMKKPLVVHVTTPKVTALRASTSATLKASGLASDDLAVQAETSAQVTLAGKCKTLDAKAMTSGKLEAGALACEDVKVDAATSADVAINASKSATGTAATSAHVHVLGNPKTKKIDAATSASVD